MFDSIDENAADYILAPIENSLAGSVHRSFDLLVESRLNIIGEEIIPIVHNLIGAPGATFEQVTVVESHPVALAQCEQILQRASGIETNRDGRYGRKRARVVAAGDHHARRDRRPARRRNLRRHSCASIWKTIARTTRDFCCFRLQRMSSENADKLSLVFQTDHRPGALFHALEPFARRGINLMKIESRPVHGRPWQYRFYLDLQASRSDPEVEAALAELEKLSRESADSGFVCLGAEMLTARRQTIGISRQHQRRSNNDCQHVRADATEEQIESRGRRGSRSAAFRRT